MSEIKIACRYDEMVDVGKVIPNPRNPNIHSDEQVVTLGKLIHFHGWRNPIVVSNRSGFIVSGHGRLMAAKELGMETVPVEMQDFESEAQEWAIMLADNFSKDMSSYDRAKVAEGLLHLDEMNYDLQLTALSEFQIRDYIEAPSWEPDGSTDVVEETDEQGRVIIRVKCLAKDKGEVKSYLGKVLAESEFEGVVIE